MTPTLLSTTDRQGTLCRRIGKWLPSLLLLIVISSLSTATRASADPVDSEVAFRTTLQPMLRQFCFDCHDSGSEIDLEADSRATAIHKNRTLWNQSIAHLRLGTMPPEDGPKLNDETRKRMIAAIDSIANAVDCVQNPNAGRVTMRRLNRTEYRNTIRDLTGVDYQPADDFPGDDVGYGFDNIGDVLSLPPILMEKYLEAALEISGQAIYTPPPAEIFEKQVSPGSLTGADRWGNRSPLGMSSNSTVTWEFTAPFSGEYTFEMVASGDQGGDEPVKAKITWGSKERIINIPNKTEETFKISMRFATGKRTIDIAFINDYYKKDVADRNMRLHGVKLTGTARRSTYVDPKLVPASHRKIIFVHPQGKDEYRQSAQSILLRFASRAFRRPATEDEVNRLVALAAETWRDNGTFEEGIQVAISAALVSPHFLFKVEQPQQPAADGTLPLISNYELATRVSYFLWSSMPDDELLAMAHQGTIRKRETLMRKVAAMLQDRRSNQFVANFVSQWLQIRNLDAVDPDTRVFRGFNEEVRELMKRETLTFFAGVMRENLPVTTLVDADFTYLNDSLANFYGIRNVNGDGFRKVSLQGSPRGGLLTHASVLTVTSNPSRTSPVKRGKWVLENLLNTPPPPAPANVPELERSKLVGTLRERLQQHRADPACASCHSMMDPIGFALENFDAVGQYRQRDAGSDIDASAKFPDGTEVQGVDGLRKLLIGKRKEDFMRCLAEKLLIYATGRGTEYYDKCAIDQIVQRCQQGGDRIAYMIAAVIESEPFQRQGFRDQPTN